MMRYFQRPSSRPFPTLMSTFEAFSFVIKFYLFHLFLTVNANMMGLQRASALCGPIIDAEMGRLDHHPATCGAFEV